ncbi:DUF5131 family protein [Sphingomonas colocasiae]|uniref:Phage Gp37/Gp68 family protein n=1 Tax=Sphingomonas colocasiae TaxID=1848973 RepID=A0ABS7Q0K9_9SPHN|nr:phage Gp37/Gp68 family protein [Sphingomonas colocasiae]MBY8826097.1 phage Gp37/Gp68 family protein [Sphingomonas colocasiae]
MAARTLIEWTDATWNVVNGCSVLSPGCKHCYAMRLAGTRLRNHPSRAGLTIDTAAGPVWNGQVRVDGKVLLQPLRWRKPKRIFVCAHGDLFHEAVSDDVIDAVFAVMALCPQHIFQVLTKRPERMRAYLTQPLNSLFYTRLDRISDAAYRIAATLKGRWDEAAGMAARQACVDALKRIDHRTNAGFKNVWLGTSVEDQPRANERIPHLLNTPAAVRFLSLEPLLGPVNLRRICIVPQVLGSARAGIHIDALAGRYVESGVPYIGDWDVTRPYPEGSPALSIDQAIVGGENGPRAMHPKWVRDIRDDCADTDTAFFLKQWGWFAPLMGARPATSGFAAWPDGSVRTGHAASRGGPGIAMFRGTKKITGRLLDGVQHSGMPA